jgi:hypothetical protein
MNIGYMEERWHWSYYPIAQALLEFAHENQSHIQARLLEQWGSTPQFSYILAHWHQYIFNVNERGIF